MCDSILSTNSILAYSSDDARNDVFGAGIYVYSGFITLDDNTVVTGNRANT